MPTAIINKSCPTCKTALPTSEFYKNRSKPDGLSTQCKSCTGRSNAPSVSRHNKLRKTKPNYFRDNRHYQLKALYGLSLEDFNALAESQQGRCALCGIVPKFLNVDHDHNTGAVRGLLCTRCNGALGSLGDSVEGLMKAVAYLEGEIGRKFGIGQQSIGRLLKRRQKQNG